MYLANCFIIMIYYYCYANVVYLLDAIKILKLIVNTYNNNNNNKIYLIKYITN